MDVVFCRFAKIPYRKCDVGRAAVDCFVMVLNRLGVYVAVAGGLLANLLPFLAPQIAAGWEPTEAPEPGAVPAPPPPTSRGVGWGANEDENAGDTTACPSTVLVTAVIGECPAGTWRQAAWVESGPAYASNEGCWLKQSAGIWLVTNGTAGIFVAGVAREVCPWRTEIPGGQIHLGQGNPGADRSVWANALDARSLVWMSWWDSPGMYDSFEVERIGAALRVDELPLMRRWARGTWTGGALQGPTRQATLVADLVKAGQVTPWISLAVALGPDVSVAAEYTGLLRRSKWGPSLTQGSPGSAVIAWSAMASLNDIMPLDSTTAAAQCNDRVAARLQDILGSLSTHAAKQVDLVWEDWLRCPYTDAFHLMRSPVWRVLETLAWTFASHYPRPQYEAGVVTGSRVQLNMCDAPVVGYSTYGSKIRVLQCSTRQHPSVPAWVLDCYLHYSSESTEESLRSRLDAWWSDNRTAGTTSFLGRIEFSSFIDDTDLSAFPFRQFSCVVGGRESEGVLRTRGRLISLGRCHLPSSVPVSGTEVSLRIRGTTVVDDMELQVRLCPVVQPKVRLQACTEPLYRLDALERRWPGYIDWWLRHHLTVYDRFVVYDNDGTAEAFVAALLHVGVEYHGWWQEKVEIPPDVRARCPYCAEEMAYHHCVVGARWRADWVHLLHSPDAVVWRSPAMDLGSWLSQRRQLAGCVSNLGGVESDDSLICSRSVGSDTPIHHPVQWGYAVVSMIVYDRLTQSFPLATNKSVLPAAVTSQWRRAKRDLIRPSPVFDPVVTESVHGHQGTVDILGSDPGDPVPVLRIEPEVFRVQHYVNMFRERGAWFKLGPLVMDNPLL